MKNNKNTSLQKIQKLSESIEKDIKQWKFKSQEYAQEAANKIVDIMKNVSPEEEFFVNIEVINLVENISERTGVLLVVDPVENEIRQLQKRIEENGDGVWEFLRDITSENPIFQPTKEEEGVVLDFLLMKHLQATQKYIDTIAYIKILKNLIKNTEDPNALWDVLMMHVDDILYDTEDEVFEEIIEEVLPTNFDKEIMRSFQNQLQVSVNEVWGILKEKKMIAAKQYYFLRKIWLLCKDNIVKCSPEHYDEMINLLNDIRDFLDPEFLSPIYFANSKNVEENLMREKLIFKDKRLH